MGLRLKLMLAALGIAINIKYAILILYLIINISNYYDSKFYFPMIQSTLYKNFESKKYLLNYIWGKYRRCTRLITNKRF